MGQFQKELKVALPARISALRKRNEERFFGRLDEPENVYIRMFFSYKDGKFKSID